MINTQSDLNALTSGAYLSLAQKLHDQRQRLLDSNSKGTYQAQTPELFFEGTNQNFIATLK